MPKAEGHRDGIARNDINIDYEAPRIELIVTEESMKREVQYAGNPISNGDN